MTNIINDIIKKCKVKHNTHTHSDITQPLTDDELKYTIISAAAMRKQKKVSNDIEKEIESISKELTIIFNNNDNNVNYLRVSVDLDNYDKIEKIIYHFGYKIENVVKVKTVNQNTVFFTICW